MATMQTSPAAGPKRLAEGAGVLVTALHIEEMITLSWDWQLT